MILPQIDVSIERSFDPSRLNAIINHPGVRPFVGDEIKGDVDSSVLVNNHNNILLMGEHGGVLCVALGASVYEFHTQILPSGRGKWSRAFTSRCAHWMFTRTDAMECLTVIPSRHIAAKAAAENAGMTYEFTRPDGCVYRGEMMDFHVYAMRIQDWVKTAPDLIEVGKWFHDELFAEMRRLGVKEGFHDDDENHNRYVGASVEMALNGQVRKAVWFFDRWAVISRYDTISLVSETPPAVRMSTGVVSFVNGKVCLCL